MATPITYSEAASLLGLNAQRIRTAVSRNVLTQVPLVRSPKQVYKEQVELFTGKPELSVSALNHQELTTWQYYRDLATPKQAPVSESPSASVAVKTVTADEILEELARRILFGKVPEKGVANQQYPFNETYQDIKALPDVEIEVSETGLKFLVGLGILLIAIGLLTKAIENRDLVKATELLETIPNQDDRQFIVDLATNPDDLKKPETLQRLQEIVQENKAA